MKSIGHFVLRSLYVLLLSLAVQPAAMAQLQTDFTASPASGCAPVFVHFADKSTGSPDSWKWDLGNGTISFLQHPSTTYFNPGKYTIKLVIKKGNLSDSLVKIGFVTINALPKPLFSASDTTGCYPLKVNFTDLSNAQGGNIVKWEWDLGDGSSSNLQNPTHVYTGPGNYNIILRVTNTAGCVSTISKAQYIKIKDGVQAAYSFTGSSQCTPPSVIHFTNSSTGTGVLSYEWLFGDGNSSAAQHPSNTYNAAGLYTIQLVVKNNAGCIDTLTKKDSIAVGVAHADFTAPDSICQNSSLQLFNTSQPITGKLLWNFDNGNNSTAANPVIMYNNPGVYNISLVADFGSCKDSITKPIKVIAAAKASFVSDKTASCSAPLTVQFKNTSVGAVSYQWLFGDSSSSVMENPSHAYTENGSYHITLIVTNSSGCKDTVRKTDYINILPADIQIKNIPASGCAPLLFSPVYSVKSISPVVSYVWNFGDGSSSTAAVPTHIYSSPGIYTLTVTYTTSDGCTGTITYTDAVKAGQKPVAAFSASPNNTCASTPVLFTNNSTGNITSWLWNFGDGLTDTARNPVHLYQDTGYFNIQLIVSNNGCTDTLLKPNLVYIKPPIAKFSADVKCSDPFRFAFTNYSIGASSWSWDFGDGNTSLVKDPVHVYNNTGNYLIKLTVINGSCTHVTAYSARIIKEKANFAAADTVVCKGDTVSLQSFGFNQSNIVSYKWMPYNGTDTAASIKAVYNKSGQYTVSLAITNSNGCTDTLVKTNYITVNGPTADFNGISNSACLKTGGSIAFADSSSTDGTHAIKKWNWNFGDGSEQSYTAAPFSHSYVAAGFYTVALTVTDTEGCSDSISKANQVYIANPIAVFSSVDTMSCKNKPVSFTNQSQGQSLRYDWGFGDATGSVQQEPTHHFANIGVYDAWLKITDAYGCTDSVFKPAYIHIDEPKAFFVMSDSASSCPPLVVNFTNQSKYYKLLSWDFGDGTGALLTDPVHYYNYPGTYYAKLVVTSPGGCTDTLSRKIVIKGPTGSFLYDKTASCNPGTVGFVAETQNTQSIIWDFNDGGPCRHPIQR